MKFDYDILSLVTLTGNSIGQKLKPNEYIIKVSTKDKILSVETRIFSESEPIPGDIVTLVNGDFLYIEDFSGGKYKAIFLTKNGLSRDLRVSPRLLSIDNNERFTIVERKVPSERFVVNYNK